MFLLDGIYSLGTVYEPGSVWSFLSLPQRAGLVPIVNAQRAKSSADARAVFGAFNDSSRSCSSGHLMTAVYLDLAKEVDDVSAVAEMGRRSQHED